ncbi:hypothetical protein [Piscinibacter sp.]|uniref:hypothetical protein n=1 Tax=Piscinibacter sp. TaxID=1903157 RepID=UPI002BF85AED|nr:hypothetical protein [Albitalea sp.]HUG26194.1 hypothetical protein [Albitalea sp.]
MKLPAFFDEVPKLRVRDPLADVLGCAEGGVFEYGYGDAVKTTGHSCPTVAAAYWLTWLALHQLFPDTLPQRGGVKVEFREDARIGSTGVVATVIHVLTGAAGGSGFKGIAGRHGRAGLMRFRPDLPMALRFTRLDNGTSVDAEADLSFPPPDPALESLLQRCTKGTADAQSLAELGCLWQERVRHLLIDLARDPGVFTVRAAERRRPVPSSRFFTLPT